MARRSMRGVATTRMALGAMVGSLLVIPVVIGVAAGPANANTDGTHIDNPSGDLNLTSPFNQRISALVTRTNDSDKTTIPPKAANPDDGNPIYLKLTDPNGATILSATNTGTSANNAPLPTATTCLDSNSGITNCNGGSGAPILNGTYHLTLTGGGSQAGSPVNQARTIVVTVPPAAPTGLAANPSSGTVVHLSWNQNTEPDRQYYDVLSSDNLLGRVSDSQVCSAGACSVDVPFNKDNAAGSHSFTVKAYRSTAPGSSDTIASAESAAVTTTLAGPPPSAPTPTPAPNGGGGSGTGTGTTTGGTGGTTNGGITGSGSTGGHSKTQPGKGKLTTPGSSRYQTQLAVHFKDFAAISGILKLPPLPAPAGEAPIPDGTFAPTLAYGDQLVPETTTALRQNSTDSLVTSFTNQFNGRQLYRSLAIALLLLLSAAHVRTWLRREEALAPSPGSKRRTSDDDGGYDW